jgi:transcriptional regulator with XRE-family HTH domain
VDLKALGSRLAKLREQRGMSGSELAERMGISRGYLSRVENGRQVPSIVLLDAIAQIFGVQLDYFFSGTSEGHVVVQRKAAAAAGRIPAKATFAYEALCKARAHKLAQPFMAVFRPQTRTRVAVHEAEYFRYVIEGRLVLHYQGERHELSAGDAVYYDASSDHEIECLGETPCKAVTLYIKPSTAGAARTASDTIEGHIQ